MKALICNVRGLGGMARVRQLKEIMGREKVDIVGLQETIKQSFSTQDPAKINPEGDFSWSWLPSSGHSGGILMGMKGGKLQVENWEAGRFFVGATLRYRTTNIRWDMIIVYGPMNHRDSKDFLGKLSPWCDLATLPIVLGGTSILSEPQGTKARAWEM
jgi:exonuclease III